MMLAMEEPAEIEAALAILKEYANPREHKFDLPTEETCRALMFILNVYQDERERPATEQRFTEILAAIAALTTLLRSRMPS